MHTDKLQPLTQLNASRFDTPKLLKAVIEATRYLAELKGIAVTMPNQAILINTLGMQEAKDSSAIENIFTTHDQLFQSAMQPKTIINPAAKEVLRYRQALYKGYELVTETGLLTSNHIIHIHQTLEQNTAGLRTQSGTTINDGAGNVVYTPPQDPQRIVQHMSALEHFINDDQHNRLDPLIRMALIHHQFESIHPFYDGNGRTGRIINVLYLVQQGLLNAPILYLSREIVRTKGEYYRLLQAVHDEDAWEEWVLYMLQAVARNAQETIITVRDIRSAFMDMKHRIREAHSFYSQDLINNLFMHPYTKIAALQNDLGVSRITATKYLETLVDDGFLEKLKIGRNNYYINIALNRILLQEAKT